MSQNKRAAIAGPGLAELVRAAKAVGHPARVRILALLHGRTLCVCQMTSLLELAFSTVSGHLNELRRAGLVLEDKQGKLVYYRLDADSPFREVVKDALSVVGRDEVLAVDRALVDRVRAVPVEVLTKAGLRLDAVGIRRPAAPGSVHGRR